MPQDGRIRLRLQDRPVDVRVATMLTLRFGPRRGPPICAALAIEEGIRGLREDGLRLLCAGVTTPADVLRVTRG